VTQNWSQQAVRGKASGELMAQTGTFQTSRAAAQIDLDDSFRD